MPIRELQNQFSLGELDPKLLSRPDFEGFYKGARKAQNTLVIPQGGLTRRFSLTYAFTVEDTGVSPNAPVTDADEVNGTVFDFSRAKQFLIIARPHDRTGTPGVAFDIYLSGALQTTETTTDYAINQINELYFLSSQDRVIILHEDVQPKQLVRGANDTTWTLSSITFNYVPVYDFSIIDDNSYRGSSVTFTPSATSGTGVTLTAANYTFNAGHVGGLYVGGGGILRITSVNSGGTVATGDTVEDFSSTSAIKGTNSFLGESAWGDFTGGTPAGNDRGWPSRGEFFQNRLVLGRTLVLNNFLSFSDSGDFYNFDDSESLDTNSFSITIGTDGNDSIQDIVGSRALVVLGLSGIYSSSLFIDQPITAGNVFLNEQDKSGSDNVKAQVMDSQIMFVDDNQQKVNAVQYDLTAGTITLNDISVFSPQVIDKPVSTAVYRPESNDGSFLLVVNDDGSLGVYQSLLNQNVQGWTPVVTQGLFKKAFASKNDGNLLVARKIGTGSTTAGTIDNVFIGNPDFESFTDISSDASSASSDVEIFGEANEYLLIGHQMPFYRIAVTLDTNASADVDLTFEYLDKFGDWISFTPTDGTSGFTGNGTISWVLADDTPDWRPLDINDEDADHLPQGAAIDSDELVGTTEKFWIRIRRTASSISTVPVEDQLLVNTADRLFVEQIDFDGFTDATEVTTSDANGLVTGLDHLQGRQVYARVDEVPEGPFFVDTSGQITVSKESSNVDVGINFIPDVIPMPIVGRQFYSQTLYNPKKIKGVFVDYFESLNITVNGFEIPTLSLNNFVLDQKPIPQTDFFEVTPMLGWDPRAKIRIRQELPQPMTIIGVGYRLEVS